MDKVYYKECEYLRRNSKEMIYDFNVRICNKNPKTVDTYYENTIVFEWCIRKNSKNNCPDFKQKEDTCDISLEKETKTFTKRLFDYLKKRFHV